MRERNTERPQTDLDWALEYFWYKIGLKVFSERKTDQVGVVAYHSDNTDNPLDKDSAYANMAVICPIQQILMPQIREMKRKLVVSSTNEGDVISAIVLAIHMLQLYCKHLKYIKNIILLTDGRARLDPSQNEEICNMIITSGIKFSVFGVDFDDPEYGYKEEGKDAEKREVEDVLKQFCVECQGTLATYAEVFDSLAIPAPRTVRPMASYKGDLILGDGEKYNDALQVYVERYPCTKLDNPRTASQCSIPASIANSSGKASNIQQLSREIATKPNEVFMEKLYKVPGKDELELNASELEKGYQFGRTIVPMGELDEEIFRIQSDTSLQIIGFIEQAGVPRSYSMSESSFIVAKKGDERGQMIISSLARTLYELEVYVLARLVPRTNTSPHLIIASSYIESGFEALVDVQVPFSEDVRQYAFAPFDRITTFLGKTLTKHRNIPTDDMKRAMGDFVDVMDLTKFGDESYLRLEDTYHFVIHRVKQVVIHRAIHPESLFPSPSAPLLKYSHPTAKVLEAISRPLIKVQDLFNVRAVPPKSQYKRTKEGDESVRPISGLDVDSLLKKGEALSEGAKRSRKNSTKSSVVIGNRNPAEDFEKALDDGIQVVEAFEQLGEVIRQLVTDSLADTSYETASDALQAMRSQAIIWNESNLYNSYMDAFKSDLLADKLGGPRRDLWGKIVDLHIGLVSQTEAEDDAVIVTDDLANEV